MADKTMRVSIRPLARRRGAFDALVVSCKLNFLLNNGSLVLRQVG